MSVDNILEQSLPAGYSPDVLKRVHRTLIEMITEIDAIFRDNGIHYFILWGTLLGAVRHGGFVPWDDDLDICVSDDEYERAIAVLREGLPKNRIVHDGLTDPLYWCDFAKVRDLNSDGVALEWPDDNTLKYRGVMVDIFRAKRLTATRFCVDSAQNMARVNWEESGRKLAPMWKRSAHMGIACSFAMTATCLSAFDRYLNMLRADWERWMIGPWYRYRDLFDEGAIFPTREMRFEGLTLPGPADPHAILRALYGDYMTLPPIGERKTAFSSVTFFDDVFPGGLRA